MSVPEGVPDVTDAVAMYGRCKDCGWISPTWHDENGLVSSCIRNICMEKHTDGHVIRFSEAYYERTNSGLVPRIRHVERRIL